MTSIKLCCLLAFAATCSIIFVEVSGIQVRSGLPTSTDANVGDLPRLGLSWREISRDDILSTGFSNVQLASPRWTKLPDGAVKYFFVSASTYQILKLRNVVNDTNKLWERQMLVYQISCLIDGTQKAVIEESMREIESDVSTDSGNCVTFKKKEGAFRDRTDYLFIALATDGWCRTDHVGMAGGKQMLYLTNDCMYKRDIMSMLLVTLGLYREHQRPDRDTYIQVHMDNVMHAARSHFKKTSSGDTDLLGLPYDFDSITHYGTYAFAINTSLPTISTNFSGVSFGHRDALSFYDVIKVQKLFPCTEGFAMFRNGPVNGFKQMAANIYYPQWHLSSEKLPDYMISGCRKTDGLDTYTLTVLNGAKWTSNFPLPSGTFCVSVDVCIASSSPDIKSYIQLMEGQDKIKLNYTQPGGQWKQPNITYTSEEEWTMVLKGYIMWGEDILALDNVIVRKGICEV